MKEVGNKKGKWRRRKRKQTFVLSPGMPDIAAKSIEILSFIGSGSPIKTRSPTKCEDEKRGRQRFFKTKLSQGGEPGSRREQYLSSGEAKEGVEEPASEVSSHTAAPAASRMTASKRCVMDLERARPQKY